MAAKKPGHAESQEKSETTGTPAADTGTNGTSAAVGGTGARATGAGGAASMGAGSGGTVGKSAKAAGAGSRSRKSPTSGGSEADKQNAAGGASRTRKSAGSKAGAKAAESGASPRRGTKAGGAKAGSGKAGGGDGLQSNLRAFVDHHPHGWSHQDWEGLLDHLSQTGIDTSDTARIGSQLEKERVVRTLENSGVSGLGGNKARSIADRFGTIRDLRDASVDDIASVSGVNRQLAEKVQEALR